MSDTKPTLDTSQRIRHVFACNGPTVHVHPGMALLINGNQKPVCPTCGAAVQDVTNSLLGQSYFAFARTDLGAQQ